MKKFLTLAFALLLSIGVSAQTPLTEAVNFSSTAHNGEKIDLFEILDGGQYVLIDFFFSTCVPCKEVAPRLIDAYYMLGCNEGDIYFMEVSPTDHNASYSIGQWFDQFDIPYPTIHTKTGGVTGDKIREMYQVESYPTLILIAPDRKIVLQHYHPESAESMVEYFTTNFDIEENYCDQTPSVSIEKTKFDGATGKDVLEASTKVHVDFRANVATEKFYYTISESANLTSEDVIADSIVATEREFSYTFDSLKSETTYFVYAQAVGHDGTNGEKTVIETRTICPGDGGEVSFEFTVNISASHVVAKAVPSESTADYHFGFTRKEYYDEGADSTTFPTENQFIFLNALANDDYPFCETETYEVPIKKDDGTPTFFPNTPYYLVAIGRNGEGQWFAPTLYEFVVEQAVGPATVDLNVKPMGTSVTISAVPNEFAVEFHFGLATKAKYDELGADSLTQIIRNDGLPFYVASESTWDVEPSTEYVAIGTAINAGNEWGETSIEFFTTDADALVETEASFNIYPNPAQSMVNIESSLRGEAQVSIFDMTGRCVKEVSAADMSNVSINVENLTKGVYFISIQQDRNHNIQKLVIE